MLSPPKVSRENYRKRERALARPGGGRDAFLKDESG